MKTLRDYEAKIFNKINPLVRFSVTRYVMAVGIFVAVLVFGIVSLVALGVDLLPDIQIPAVVVKTTYPGATPSVMDLQVTQVIENVVSSISGITDINSRSSLGLGLSVFTFDPSTDKYADANQVATAVSASIRSLPAERHGPVDPDIRPELRSRSPVRPFRPGDQPRGRERLRAEHPRAEHRARRRRGHRACRWRADQAVHRAPGPREAALLQSSGPGCRQRDRGLRPQHADRDDRQEQERPDIPDAEPAGGPAPDQPHARGFHAGDLRRPDRARLVESRFRGLRARERQAGGAPLRPAHDGLERRCRRRQGEAAAAEHHAAGGLGDALQQRHDGADQGVRECHVSRAFHYRHRRRLHRAPVPRQAEYRPVRDTCNPHCALRFSRSLQDGRLLAQPGIAARADHRHRNRGRRLHRGLGERGALPRDGVQSEGVRAPGRERGVQRRGCRLALPSFRASAGELYRRIHRCVCPAVLPGHGRGGRLLPPGSRALPHRAPGVHPGAEGPHVEGLPARLDAPASGHPVGLEELAKGGRDYRRSHRRGPDPGHHAQAPVSSLLWPPILLRSG